MGSIRYFPGRRRGSIHVGRIHMKMTKPAVAAVSKQFAKEVKKLVKKYHAKAKAAAKKRK